MAARKRSRARRSGSKSKRKSAPKRAKASASKKKARRATPARKKAARKPAARKPAARKPAAPAAPRRVPNGIGLVMHHSDYTSHDMDGVRRFYTEVLGFKQFQEMDQGPYLYIATGATSSLGFMPPMPGPPEQWRPPREPALYFMVENVDKAYADLVAKGVAFDQAPMDTPWGHRFVSLKDPEGRAVCLAHQLKK